jgi:protocatechuate 3,4-dioxygenase beta subunit
MNRVAIVAVAASMIVPLAAAAIGHPADRAVADQRPAPREPAQPEPSGSSVISGRVVAAQTGRPLRRVQVTLGAKHLRQGRTTVTASDGSYEFADLAPGRYSLVATRNGYLPQIHGQRHPSEDGEPVDLGDNDHLRGVDFALWRTASISGRLTDELGEPYAGVVIYPMKRTFYLGAPRPEPTGSTTRTDEEGYFRVYGLQPGSYYLLAVSGDTWTERVGDGVESHGYMATYYPGTPDFATAQPIDVAFGAEIPAVDFSLVPGRAGSIAGFAIDPDGRPLTDATVSVTQEVGQAGWRMSHNARTAPVGPDGFFLVGRVPPGEYRVLARRTTGAPPRPDSSAIASTTVVVAGDVAGVTLRFIRAPSLTGRIRADEGSRLDFPASELRVRPRPADPATSHFIGPGPSAVPVERDWTFAVGGFVGPHRVDVTGLPDGWALESVSIGARDVTDAGVDLTEALDGQHLAIVVTSATGTLTGRVTGDGDAPAVATVIVFPEDRARWGDGSRFVRTVRPARDGSFATKGLPPGVYLVAARESLDEDEAGNPEFLGRLRDEAVRVTIGESETKAVEVRVRR